MAALASKFWLLDIRDAVYPVIYTDQWVWRNDDHKQRLHQTKCRMRQTSLFFPRVFPCIRNLYSGREWWIITSLSMMYIILILYSILSMMYIILFSFILHISFFFFVLYLISYTLFYFNLTFVINLQNNIRRIWLIGCLHL